MQPLYLEIKPSYTLCWVFGIIHLAAAVGFVWAAYLCHNLLSLVFILMVAAVGFNYRIMLRVHAQRTSPYAIVGLQISQSGWRLTTRAGTCLAHLSLLYAYSLHRIAFLHFKGNKKRVNLIFINEALNQKEWQKLIKYLRLRVGE
jgi:hypothetical protein